MDVTGKDLAPIVLFVYNRPWHTQQTLEAIEKNDLADQSILYVFCDGPKNDASEDTLLNIEKTRALVKSKPWCKKIIIEEKETNAGLANSIIEGVTKIVNQHGKIIVLEDDIVTSVGFLRYMNTLLDLYQFDDRIMHLSGYIYPTKRVSRKKTMVVNVLSCWGWATWDRAWKHFNSSSSYHLNKIGSSSRAINKFNVEGHAHFYQQLLLNNQGKINTWAVKWYASWLYANGKSIFPNKPLIKNIGHDNSGENCDLNNIYENVPTDSIAPERHSLNEDKLMRKEIDDFFKEHFTIKPAEKETINKKLNRKIRIILRKTFLKTFPELKDLLGNKDYPFYHRNTLINSSINKKAILYPPSKTHNSTVGANTYVAPNSIINNAKIGKFCSIGPNFVCGWGKHPIDGISTSPMFYSSQKQNGTTLSADDKVLETEPIIIGNDVFIGMNVTVLDGITIGDGAVIGAGAVVSKNIPPYAIAVGNPIRIIKYRFNEQQIERLLKVCWWDWEENRLQDVEKYFFEVDQFLNKHLNNGF